ncbi:MAG: enolase [Pseudomonadota bacterium]
MTEPAPPPPPQAVILAFEGILAPSSVLRDTLEPYALEALPAFLEQHAEATAVQRTLSDILAYAGRELDVEGLLAQVRAWIRAGQDITPVRQLQGLIWADALEAGALRPTLGSTTAEALQQLHDAGVALYSFGATPAPVQRDWLRHGPHPEVEQLLSGLFDTRIGGRRDAGSYRRLAEEIGVVPEVLLVLSTRTEELDAAGQAWLPTARPASDSDPDDRHPVRSLTSLIPTDD